MNDDYFQPSGPENIQIIGTVHVTRIINEKGDIQTNWKLTEGMTYEEAITALEMTKLKIHHHMMKDHGQ